MDLYELKNYGKTTINLKTILQQKGMSKNRLATKMQTSYDLVNRYCSNNVVRIDLDIISRMCYILECDISDLLKYKKN